MNDVMFSIVDALTSNRNDIYRAHSAVGASRNAPDMKPDVKLEIKIEEESDDEAKSENYGSDHHLNKEEIDTVPVEFEQTVRDTNSIEDDPKKPNTEIKVEKPDHIQIEIEDITSNTNEENVVKKSSGNHQNSCTPHSCTICKLVCVSTSQLQTHLRVHTGVKPYSCSLCAYTSAQKGNLANHLRSHTKDKPFSCQMCGFRCKVKDRLKKHFLRMHDKQKKLEIKERTDQFEIQDSASEINTTEIKPAKQKVKSKTLENNKNTSKNYSCTTCKLKFTTRSKLTTHSRSHTEEKLYHCPFCNSKYAKKKDVETHILQSHNEDKPYACHKCGYKCKLKNYLIRHVCIHTGMKTFSCSVCEYKTKDLRSFDVHMIIHGGIKPYSCKSCNKKFATRSAWERHSASIEQGTRITNAVCTSDDN